MNMILDEACCFCKYVASCSVLSFGRFEKHVPYVCYFEAQALKSRGSTSPFQVRARAFGKIYQIIFTVIVCAFSGRTSEMFRTFWLKYDQNYGLWRRWTLPTLLY
jgi:hypothetical protein